MMRRRQLAPFGAALAGTALAPFARAASAAEFPARSLRLELGFAAGGPTDVIARVIAQDMTAFLGQPVIVENRTGANSLVATEFVAREAADGYTLLMATLAHNVNPILMPQAHYRPLQDFTPIALVAMLPLIAVASRAAPFDNIQAVVAAAKRDPGEITYGSAGNGGSAHLAGALLASLSGTRMTHVPFRGNAPALSEVMAGRVSFMFYPMIGIADFIAQGQLKPLAISTAQRTPDYPDVPTMAEAGFPGFEEYTQGLGVLGPAHLPDAVTAKLNAAIRQSLSKPETVERLRTLGATVAGSSPAEYADFLRDDAKRWAKVIAAAGISAQD